MMRTVYKLVTLTVVEEIDVECGPNCASCAAGGCNECDSGCHAEDDYAAFESAWCYFQDIAPDDVFYQHCTVTDADDKEGD